MKFMGLQAVVGECIGVTASDQDEAGNGAWRRAARCFLRWVQQDRHGLGSEASVCRQMQAARRLSKMLTPR